MNRKICSAGRVSHGPCMMEKVHQKKAENLGFGWSSSNWSGYAVKGSKGAYKSISAEWIVPKVNPSNKPSFSSIWIGIDGFDNTALIQVGTEQDYFNGSAHYYAWWEILPAFERKISLPVSPGDRMRAQIKKLSTGKWSIQLKNATKHWSFQTIRNYTGAQSSAEWIVEAPQVNGKIAGLANYLRTAFDYCKVNGSNPKLIQANGGVMVQDNDTVSVPSLPDRERDGFTVSYRSTSISNNKRNSRFTPNQTKPLLLNKENKKRNVNN